MKPSIIVCGITEETAHYQLFVVEDAKIVYEESCYLYDIEVITKTEIDEDGDERILETKNDYSEVPVLGAIHEAGTKEYGDLAKNQALYNRDMVIESVTKIHPEFNPINVIAM